MTGRVGEIALAAGLVASLVALVLAARTGRREPVGAGTKGAVWSALGAAAVAFAALEHALVTSDFSVRFVAENSSRATPLLYRVTGLWAGLEGSLVLWLLLLAGCTAAVAQRRTRGEARSLQPVALAVLSGISAFFFGLAFFGGNAFDAVSPVPADGPGPNPLLQDHPLMAVHPPLLYLGYVAAAVPFAYAVAALVRPGRSAAWAREIRGWTYLVWGTLTAGIFLGAWWSYAVLGWGGYWAWDPVENAAIMPWLTATALLHTAMVHRRRSALPVWTVTLATATFVLVVLGTFFTRSGVLESVHAFSESGLGPALLGFVLVTMIFAVGLLSLRGSVLTTDRQVGGGLSRDGAVVANNLLLVAMAAIVMLGTVFPLAVEALQDARVTVGPPYFNRMALPLGLTVLVLMAVGPLLPWVAVRPAHLARRLRVPAAAALLVVGGLGIAGVPHRSALLLFGASSFVLACTAIALADRLAPARSLPAALGMLRSRRRILGGLLVHAGVALAAVAIAASGYHATHAEATVPVGGTVAEAGYTARLVEVARERTERRMRVAAEVEVLRDGDVVGTAAPALNFYPSTADAIGTPSVVSRWWEDVYVTVSGVAQDGSSATIRVTVTPMVSWLWAAGGVMVAGCLMAGLPVRRRPPAGRDALAAPPVAADPAGVGS